MMRTELFRGLGRDERLAEVADAWHLALLEKGFSGDARANRPSQSPAALGTCFRSLRDRAIGGFILLRDGTRAWRLRRR